MTPDELRTAMCTDTTGPLTFPVSFVPDDEEPTVDKGRITVTGSDGVPAEQVKEFAKLLSELVEQETGEPLKPIVDDASELDRLRALAGELAARLKPLAELGRRWADSGFGTAGLRDDCPLLNSGALTLGDARRAADVYARYEAATKEQPT